MFALPGIMLLVLVLVLHPQESWVWLTAYQPLYGPLGAAMLGLVLDLRLRFVYLRYPPHLWWVIAFFVWCMVGVLINDRAALSGAALSVMVSVLIFFLIAVCVQTFRGLQALLGFYLAITLFLAFVGVHQRYSPMGCLPDTSGARSVWDGRYCATRQDCENDEGAEPGVEYTCAHIGLFGTTSIGERIRYLGKLEDPNVLSLVTGIGLPIALGFYVRKRTATSLMVMVGALALDAQCAIFSQSRGGQLVVLVVLGTYFVQRVGVRGLILGAALALPVMLLGGRDDASDSSAERLECAVAGMKMIASHPIFGVGQGQFVEHHFLTAHNSFVLAAAELGFAGMMMWTAIVYLSVKIPIMAHRRYGPGHPDARFAAVAFDWSMVLIAGWIGFLVGIFFLSYCYNENLWIYMGFSAALYGAIRRHDPSFSVSIGWKELLLLAMGNGSFLFVWNLYARWKTGMW